jgi:hypothetical protein
VSNSRFRVYARHIKCLGISSFGEVFRYPSPHCRLDVSAFTAWSHTPGLAVLFPNISSISVHLRSSGDEMLHLASQSLIKSFKHVDIVSYLHSENSNSLLDFISKYIAQLWSLEIDQAPITRHFIHVGPRTVSFPDRTQGVIQLRVFMIAIPLSSKTLRNLAVYASYLTSLA